MKENTPKRFSIPFHQEKGEREDIALLRALKEIPGFESTSRSQIQRWLKEKCFKLVEPGLMELEIPEVKLSDLTAVDRPIDIVYEDEFLLVVNKPQGMSVHPSPSEKDVTLVQVLLHRLKGLSSIGGVERPGIVHRIDKLTSGLLVVAKDDPTHIHLAKQFHDHTIKRSYWAICYGFLKSEGIRIESHIGRNPTDRIKMAFEVKDGRRAVTHLKKLKNFQINSSTNPFASWNEARLETGRTHQVRVHLTHEGASVLGDPLYGIPSAGSDKWKKIPFNIRKIIEGLSGQMLHARSLTFIHPKKETEVSFEVDPPSDFQNLLKNLEAFSNLTK